MYSRPAQTTHVLDMSVENQCRPTWVSQVLEKQSYHFVPYIGSMFGSSPSEDFENDEFILDALDPEIGEISPMKSEEYEATMKKYDDELTEVDN
jgi:hypothetical protein